MEFKMKKNLLSSLIISTFACLSLSTSVLADQPEWAGNGKATSEQKQEHKSAMKEKRGPDQKGDKLKNQEHYDEHHNDRYENRHEERYGEHHDDRHDERYEENHEERYGEHHNEHQPIETDNQPNPEKDNRGFQQRMKDLFGW